MEEKFRIGCNGFVWNVKAGNLESAVGQVVVAEKNRLKELSKRRGKKLTLDKLDISWRTK